MFSQNGQVRKEPDILIIDKELGLIIIEVKGININNIETINGSVWYFKDMYQETASPYEQAQGQMCALISRTFLEPKLFGCVAAKVLVALPYITEEWQEKGLDKNPSCLHIVFEDNLGKIPILKCIADSEPLQKGTVLDDELWKLLYGYEMKLR